MSPRVPFRWPAAWDSAKLRPLLEDSPFKAIQSAPQDVVLVKGLWPSVKTSASGSGDGASAGPTGVPWVDSNYAKIRLAAAQKPGTPVWVDAAPPKQRPSADAYVRAVADAGAWGGTWIAALDDDLAAKIASSDAEALRTLERIKQAAGFFRARSEWPNYRPEGVLGIVSSYAGANEFFGLELINLTTRAAQQFRVIPADQANATAFHGLKAVIWADGEGPAPALRKALVSFAESGGLLIAGPQWGRVSGHDQHPRYTVTSLGKGRLAVSKEPFEDPYIVANDSVALTSHRHDLLRFWNGGAFNAQKSLSPDGARALVQMVFYASGRGGDPTLWIAGRYRSARLWTLDAAESREAAVYPTKNGVEVHLTAAGPYVAVELESLL